MPAIEVFSVRDLRNRASALVKDTRKGRLSLITRHGRPTAIALPFDSVLLEQGVHRNLAVRLFEQKAVTLAQAARIADMPIAAFLDVLRTTGINVVDYPAREVAKELDAIR